MNFIRSNQLSPYQLSSYLKVLHLHLKENWDRKQIFCFVLLSCLPPLLLLTFHTCDNMLLCETRMRGDNTWQQCLTTMRNVNSYAKQLCVTTTRDMWIFSVLLPLSQFHAVAMLTHKLCPWNWYWGGFQLCGQLMYICQSWDWLLCNIAILLHNTLGMANELSRGLAVFVACVQASA